MTCTHDDQTKHSIHFAKMSEMRNEKITNKQQHNDGKGDEEEEKEKE